jgi:hypothetical protein
MLCMMYANFVGDSGLFRGRGWIIISSAKQAGTNPNLHEMHSARERNLFVEVCFK